MDNTSSDSPEIAQRGTYPRDTVLRNAEKLGINYNELPQMPFWSPMFGRTQESYRFLVAENVMSASIVIGRELTPLEREALAQHRAKMLVTQEYSIPIAIAATIGFYRRTYNSFGFPFWTPKPEKFNPNKLGPLPEGFISQRAWHGLRVAAWYTTCRLTTSLFFFSYAFSVYLAGRERDPRLRDYIEACNARAGLRRDAAMRQRGQIPPSSASGNTPPTSSPWLSSEQPPQDGQSPWPETQSSQPETASTQSSVSEESHVFDDASPVAPSEQQRGSSQPPVQGGSAWDRIRGHARGSAGEQGQAGAWVRKRQDEVTSRGSQDGTSYNFSSGDEEKAYAKEQAQREFDEMLERERRGQGDGSRRS